MKPQSLYLMRPLHSSRRASRHLEFNEQNAQKHNNNIKWPNWPRPTINKVSTSWQYKKGGL